MGELDLKPPRAVFSGYKSPKSTKKETDTHGASEGTTYLEVATWWFAIRLGAPTLQSRMGLDTHKHSV